MIAGPSQTPATGGAVTADGAAPALDPPPAGVLLAGIAFNVLTLVRGCTETVLCFRHGQFARETYTSPTVPVGIDVCRKPRVRSLQRWWVCNASKLVRAARPANLSERGTR